MIFLPEIRRGCWFALTSTLLPTTLPLGATVLEDVLPAAWQRAEQRSEATVTWLQGLHGTPGLYTRYPQTGNLTTGKWNVTTNAGDWRAGFWPGVVWLLAQRTGSETWKQRAVQWSAALATSPNDDHDIGFIALGSMGKGYLFHDEINDPGASYRNLTQAGLSTAATKLDLRYNMPTAPLGPPVPTGLTRSWGTWFGKPYPVCIDNMMNIEAMFLAYELNGRQPAQRPWFDHALQHARSSVAKLMRPNGSTYHVVCHFESGPNSGNIERKVTHQGYAHETTWSRGQAWAIYGLTAAYRHARRDPATNASDLLAAACDAADYYIDHLPHYRTSDTLNHRPGDFVPPSDFDASLGEPIGPWNDANNNYNSSTGTGLGDRRAGTGGLTQRDASAAAVAASGLIELSNYAPTPSDRTRYWNAARDMLHCLITYDGPDLGTDPDYLCAANDLAFPGILKGCSERWSFPYNSLIYGDYYFLEALTRYEAHQERRRLANTQSIRHQPTRADFSFEIRTPAPTLTFRIERATNLAVPDWTTVATRTGNSLWSGSLAVTEEPLPGQRARVTITDSAPGPRAFFRIQTRSIGGDDP